MKVALTGLMQSGKSTLFAAISGRPAPAMGAVNIEEAVVPVPDPRVDWLSELYQPKKTTYATVDCLDLPGLSFQTPSARSAATRLLDKTRTVDMFVLVARAFQDPAVPPYGGSVDPARDLIELKTELLLADLQLVTNRIERLEVQVKKPTKQQDRDKAELALQLKLQQGLEAEEPVRALIEIDAELELVRSLNFLTLKPIMVVLNVGEDQLGADIDLGGAVGDSTEVAALCAKLESELAELDAQSRSEFMSELGLAEPAVSRFVRSCYAAVGLISFLTVGKDEVRSWPIRNGSTAWEAAGKIHSDIQRGFIRAETMAFDALREHGDEKAVRAAGKARLEGKDYVVQDGDIIDFRFSV